MSLTDRPLAVLPDDGLLAGEEASLYVFPTDVPSQLPGVAERLRLVSRGFGAIVALLGVIVLLGYVFESARVVQISPSLPPMYPNAAIALSCAGIAVLLATGGGWRRSAGLLCGAVTTAIGAIALMLNAAGAPRTAFEALFPVRGFVASTTPVGGRPVVESSLALTLIGVSVITSVARRSPLVSQVLACAAAAIGLSATVGYALGIDRADYRSSVFVGMALHTAVAIIFASVAVLFSRPSAGLVGNLLGTGATGALSRRSTVLLAAASLVMLATSIVVTLTAPSPAFAQSVTTVMQVALTGALILVPAATIGRMERAIDVELGAARRLVESASDVTPAIESIVGELMLNPPVLPGWEVGFRHEPAFGHLAGDSLQVLPRGGSHPSALVVVADMAGHDARAAILAYGLRSHIAALWEQGCDLEAIAASASRKLCRRGTITTAVLLEVAEDRIRMINAGHPPPVHVRDASMTEWPLTGPLLGVPTETYAARSEVVREHDLIVVYTDGITEARPGRGPLLGDDAIRERIRFHRLDPAQTIADSCIDAALAHAEQRLSDDALVVVLRRLAERE